MNLESYEHNNSPDKEVTVVTPFINKQILLLGEKKSYVPFSFSNFILFLGEWGSFTINQKNVIQKRIIKLLNIFSINLEKQIHIETLCVLVQLHQSEKTLLN